jgi:hypothetical protein
MWMLIQKTKTKEGAYSVLNKDKQKVLFLFEEVDDAERYAMMLGDRPDQVTRIVQVDPELAIKTCIKNNLGYSIITPDDFVIPPK